MPNLLRNFAFRLSLWYAFIFAVSATALLALCYYFVANALQRKDQEIILAQLKEYATVYQAGGAPALQLRAMQENDPTNDKPFFVSLQSPQVSLSLKETPN